MQKWTLEVIKMGLYIAFPVTIFHLFNQPEYFEEWVTKTRQELYPPDDGSNAKLLKEASRLIRAKAEEKELKSLEEMEAKRKLIS